ncbi:MULTISPECIES: C40 family peptidase [Achromobacter]|uniref:Peptidoglycan endopeptidase n=2 Tax=Achromobacter TaxID=222 RepID=A0A0X8NW39_ALCXX|nr:MULTISPECIES: C40 family peptidase [Achromobacter]AMG35424.1 peptidoglycan endopeptidase [Achromobacter xylosoxidans]EGP43840.1 NlpC/P60 family protein 2 [Achromobacter insuavis AXX-A]
MTPPTRKARSALFRLPVFLSAPLLALTFSWLPGAAQASIPSEQARATLSGLSLAQEPTVPTLRERVVQAGLSAIGTPYSWGGDDAAEGFDCSGLVLYVFREIAGLELPRTARQQRTQGDTVSNKKLLKPGDLVFFATRGRGITSHVGIYIGQDKFVHAPRRGAKVRVDEMKNPYWSKRYLGARSYIDTAKGQMLAAR